MSNKHFLLIYDLSADYLERRGVFRADHLALAKTAADEGKLLAGGALLDPSDQAFLLFRGDTPAAAAAFAAADPYVLNGLVVRWRVREWKTVVGPMAIEQLAL